MIDLNFPIIALAAIVPLLLGFVWYHPKVFGNAWMSLAGLTEESMKGTNMGKVFLVTYLLSFLMALALLPMVIHQYGIYSILAEEPGINDPESETGKYLSDFMARYGSNFRSFKHGVFHGVLSGIFLVMPLVAINALFERRKFKYTLINSGYWMLCLGIMGGILCAFG